MREAGYIDPVTLVTRIKGRRYDSNSGDLEISDDLGVRNHTQKIRFERKDEVPYRSQMDTRYFVDVVGAFCQL